MDGFDPTRLRWARYGGEADTGIEDDCDLGSDRFDGGEVGRSVPSEILARGDGEALSLFGVVSGFCGVLGVALGIALNLGVPKVCGGAPEFDFVSRAC